MMQVRRISKCVVLGLGLVLTSSGVAHAQAAASSDVVGGWRSPAFTSLTLYGTTYDEKGTVTDAFSARTTILLQRDSTWLSYTTFRDKKQAHRATMLNSGGLWRQQSDTLWLADDAKWSDAAIAYTPDGEAIVRDTLKTRPQPAATAWKAYRATIRDQQLSIGQFGATDTAGLVEPFVCGTPAAKGRPAIQYDRLVCPGIYDHRTASTP